jgi:RES domain-containing protein
MRLWRLSGRAHAHSFDGGYGLEHDGRWNSAGHAVTYCATSPALCVLEKLVHIEDPALMPALVMLGYDAPDDLAVETVGFDALPRDWRQDEAWTQRRGDAWHASARTPLLRVPSVIVAPEGTPDWNIVLNHRHAAIPTVRLAYEAPYSLDPRLI